jgi:D(-)-tartrate dehydratase
MDARLKPAHDARESLPMRIVDIRETAVPLKSKLANASFDFSEMTTSVVAVITDVIRNGKPVCGFAFNSTGRYACGAQMRARFIPRILAADPPLLSTRKVISTRKRSSPS